MVRGAHRPRRRRRTGRTRPSAGVSVAGYRSHTLHYPARDHLEAGAPEIYQPALDLRGGVTGARAVATLVEAYDKRVVPHAFAPAINYAASLHVAAASPIRDLIEFAVYDDTVDDTGRVISARRSPTRTLFPSGTAASSTPRRPPGWGWNWSCS